MPSSRERGLFAFTAAGPSIHVRRAPRVYRVAEPPTAGARHNSIKPDTRIWWKESNNDGGGGGDTLLSARYRTTADRCVGNGRVYGIPYILGKKTRIR